MLQSILLQSPMLTRVQHECRTDESASIRNMVKEAVCCSSSSPSRTITIVHFNDVYNIEGRSQEPVGGAARFCTAVSQLSASNPLVLFSGDAFNPSISK